MAQLVSIDTPRTPIMKRFIRGLLKPSVGLGKRNRDADQENTAPSEVASSKISTNCVALQNEDEDEDVIVITALHTIPFCCHADLLIMSRSELIAAAQALNTKLPKVLQIDLNDNRSDNFIRHSIELIVGIRNEGSRGQKRDRSLSLYATDFEASVDQTSTTILPSSPMSPLAALNRTNRSFGGSPANESRLKSLREEDEDSNAADRPTKRRRTEEFSLDGTPTPTPRPRRMSMSIQSPLANSARRAYRSQSQRVPADRLPRLHRNITLNRGGGRSRSQSAVLTSTPKTRRLVPKTNRNSWTAGIQDTVGEPSFSSLSTVSAATTMTHSVSEGVERVSGWLQQNGEPEVGQEVTRKLKGMSLESSSSLSSDMDISD